MHVAAMMATVTPGRGRRLRTLLRLAPDAILSTRVRPRALNTDWSSTRKSCAPLSLDTKAISTAIRNPTGSFYARGEESRRICLSSALCFTTKLRDIFTRGRREVAPFFPLPECASGTVIVTRVETYSVLVGGGYCIARR